MTIKYDNVYIKETSTVVGPYEDKGPLSNYFDYASKDFYIKAKTLEQAEVAFQNKSIDLVCQKNKITKDEIDVLLGGDLTNQIAVSNFNGLYVESPYIGLYAACATSTLEIIIASMLIDKYKQNNIVCTTSSHNLTAEKQFRYPNEYGGIKPLRSTFTSTGAASILLGNKKSKIKVTYGTLGKVCDAGCTDAFNMGEVMAIAAAHTLYKHLQDTKRKSSYYDIILTGDLGIYGIKILKEYMNKNYNIDLDNINDCGCILYDTTTQQVYAGASGPVCLPLVAYGKIYQEMIEGKLNKVLLIATGAIFSPTTLFQKLSIPSIAHAISLEVVK